MPTSLMLTTWMIWQKSILVYGYTFISQQEALEDEAYLTPITRYGPWGISWIDRWAISRGVDRSFFEGDPVTPNFVWEIYNQ